MEQVFPPPQEKKGRIVRDIIAWSIEKAHHSSSESLYFHALGLPQDLEFHEAMVGFNFRLFSGLHPIQKCFL